MNLITRTLIFCLIVGMIVTTGFGIAYQRAAMKSPGYDPNNSPVYFFTAKLISVPDQHKQMQWSATPLSSTWETVIMVDLDRGSPVSVKAGDTIKLVGELDRNGNWSYWYEPHWLDNRTFLSKR